MAALARSQRAFSAALILIVGLALAPAGGLGWTGVLAEIVSVPVQPMADAGVRLSRVLRTSSEFAGESEVLRQRTADLEATRALLHRERQRVVELLEEIAALSEVRELRPGVGMTALYARVTGLSPDRSEGPVRLNAGSRDGVEPGAVAVYRGGYLVGRAGAVERLSSRLVPLTDRSTGLIEAVVYKPDDPLAHFASLPRLQLQPDGRGRLVGDIDRETDVRPGDVLRLSDQSWPETAQGLIIGTVEAVEPKDLQPLLDAVVVRPRYKPQRVATVTLLIERVVETARGGGAGLP